MRIAEALGTFSKRRSAPRTSFNPQSFLLLAQGVSLLPLASDVALFQRALERPWHEVAMVQGYVFRMAQPTVTGLHGHPPDGKLWNAPFYFLIKIAVPRRPRKVRNPSPGTIAQEWKA